MRSALVAMFDCLRIRLEAQDAAAGDSHSYDIQIGRDLFATWTITLRHRPGGRTGRMTRFVAASEMEACRVLGERLPRRRSGQRYKLREVSAAASLDLLPWLGSIYALLNGDGVVRGTSTSPEHKEGAAGLPEQRSSLRAPGARERAVGAVVDLAGERRRRALEQMQSDIEATRDELLAVYAAAPEPSHTGEAATVLIERCDLLLEIIERLASTPRPDPAERGRDR